MDKVKEACGNCPNSKAVERAIADFLYLPLSFYTDNLTSVYIFIGSENIKMQNVIADAVRKMNLNHNNTTLIDGCCGTGSLFFGLDTYDWKHIILNDMNPIKTNILNVIKENGLEFMKYIFEDGSLKIVSVLQLKKNLKKDLIHIMRKEKIIIRLIATLILQSKPYSIIVGKGNIQKIKMRYLKESLKFYLLL